jgi:hypothetical protein
MIEKRLGFINTPMQGNKLIPGVTWCADNSCFGKNYPGDEKWFAWLAGLVDQRESCLFATAPDVVGDAEATLQRSVPWLSKIRSLGFKAALVAQDGLEDLEVPWDEFDCLFIGGSTEWKLGSAARQLAHEAKRRGKWVHGGRCNSKKRFFYMAGEMGCDSADGTFLTFGPDVNLPRLMGWIDDWNSPKLF